MKQFVKYDSAGRILGYGICSKDSDFALQASDGLQVIEAPEADASLSYVSGGSVVARPACPVSANSAGLTVNLAGVPLGARIRVDGDAMIEDTNDDPSGAIALVFGAAGTYHVTVECFPARDFDQAFALI